MLPSTCYITQGVNTFFTMLSGTCYITHGINTFFIILPSTCYITQGINTICHHAAKHLLYHTGHQHIFHHATKHLLYHTGHQHILSPCYQAPAKSHRASTNFVTMLPGTCYITQGVNKFFHHATRHQLYHTGRQQILSPCYQAPAVSHRASTNFETMIPGTCYIRTLNGYAPLDITCILYQTILLYSPQNSSPYTPQNT